MEGGGGGGGGVRLSILGEPTESATNSNNKDCKQTDLFFLFYQPPRNTTASHVTRSTSMITTPKVSHLYYPGVMGY